MDKLKRPVYCSVQGCKKKKKAHEDCISFHKPPKDRSVFNKWLLALKVKNLSVHARICNHHFLPEDFLPVPGKKQLKPEAVPSLNVPVSLITTITRDPNLPKKRKERIEKRNLKKIKLDEENQAVNENVQDSNVQLLESDVPHINLIDSDNGVAYDAELIEDITHKDSGVQATCDVIVKSTQTDLSGSTFKLTDAFNSEENLKIFTGVLSFKILLTLEECISELRKIGKKKRIIILSLRDCILLTFVKLKQNLPYNALGVLFGISHVMAKKCFINTLKELALVLKCLLRWPSKEEILNNMPKCFDKYKGTRIVLDCLEIPIRQSKCLKCRIPTYSNYKGRHTVKIMLGVTPSGMISYVSKAYGGRVSDKAIFKRSHLLDRMIRGVDQIMIDRGFLIERECAEFGIKIIRPPFLRKKKKFSANEATSGADISSARVHVERRIKRIREFVIMQGPLSTEIVPYINIITKVICAYSNLCSPILSEDKFRAQY
ncbi:uncharacterized protein LOC106660532 [Trichogramma pretiosum]|uniref:uncharacterized protein LOC106660532 n=1 Tax=Trichogramma pretiosum TaxID=7493 RepID=UPI0006C9AD4A|nr:uncharacterized protein LOC106660532 [Trichogramma pretiosum]